MARGASWTREETEKVFKLLDEGKTYQEIGEELGRTEYAIKKHTVKERRKESGKYDDFIEYDIRYLFKDVEKSKMTDYKEVDALNFKRFVDALNKQIKKEKMIFRKKVVYHNANYIVVDLGKYRKTLTYNDIYEKMKKKGE